MSDKPLVILKPNIVNALFPIFLKNMIFSLAVVVPTFFIYIGFFGSEFSMSVLVGWAIGFLFVLALLPLLVRILVLKNTTYYFMPTYLVSQFELFIIKRYSVPYQQIVNVRTNISLWDRFCNAGDIIVHTAENNAPDMHLRYLKNTEKLEQYLYKLMAKKK